MFFSCICIHAEELVVYLKTGEQVSFILEKKPVISFSNDSLVIKSDNSDYLASIDNIEKYSFKTITTGLDSVSIENKLPSFHHEHVIFENLEVGSKVSVYDISGRLKSAYIVDVTGVLDINLATLPKGHYILSGPAFSFKFSNR